MVELYVSTDVETDGPIPGPHSMLSFGSAAFTADGEMISTFSANLMTLTGAKGHPETMALGNEAGGMGGAPQKPARPSHGNAQLRRVA